MPATERDEALPREVSEVPSRGVSAVPMCDLLASCAAAKVISTPPRVPDPEAARPRPAHRETGHTEAGHRETGHRDAA
ncbi:hypothetical protein [Streptomyces sp. NPDC020996]|uniref:hypothetical protein n=1 Tax=Streptomyces sp. NPDC020996 TaxID=3154791 RepID=UPI0033FB57A7